MKLLIHDLQDDVFSALNVPQEDITVFAAKGKFAPCVGCYKCWMKTPGQCYVKDGLQHVGALFGKCDEAIIISENCYGGYSEAVKRVFDRSISTSVLFFTYRGGMMHHIRRYKNPFALRVFMYGDITEAEKAVAQQMVKANQNNIGCKEATIDFMDKPEDIGELLQ